MGLRRQKTDRSAVDNPMAFPSTTATRLTVDVAQSARVRRESEAFDYGCPEIAELLRLSPPTRGRS
ncbi:hypothetical protein [Streptomyces aquilus]|uniref:hypothetical protein n=1 Tax=Streptomyces aquilus TaxID=2548456 RepID=UPI003693BD76